MGYVAVKGGREAIQNSQTFFKYVRDGGASASLELEQIREQLYLAVDRVMGEGSLYAPDHAALAIKQAAGDTFEAAFMLRAYRTTQPRLGYTLPAHTRDMHVMRRISAAFKEIPGGQVLGPTSDYTLRLLDFDLAEQTPKQRRTSIADMLKDVPDADPLPDTFPKVVDILRREGLIAASRTSPQAAFSQGEIFDVTRQSLSFPAPRSAALQSMARGETGGLLALAYSNMRGYGMIHPTIGELRVGFLPLYVTNPYTEKHEYIGRVKVTEAEVIAKMDKDHISGGAAFTLGYGLCFGHNETKAISMAVLDRSMQRSDADTPSADQEFVLLHTDGIEAMGFCNHYKLPHYVTFQSELDRLRKARENQ